MMKPAIRGLYAVTPDCTDTLALIQQVKQTIEGGVRILQYRSKLNSAQLKQEQAYQLQILCKQSGVLFIINDDIELAMHLKADGVHLGLEDATLRQARTLLGPDVIIGASCYDQLAFARQARDAGADYLAFGAVFPSSSKPDTVNAPLSLFSSARKLALPLVAIGGININNAASVISAGADAIAVINGLFAAADPCLAAQKLSRLFD
jgi:thiamine-phosphate pyrophosphorylase